ncbi:MAG: calcium-binding protein [Gammaproteobacteria bacterium]|nr:MAG: calcium-binding protein [Gammaproteobacteria bacterium]
MLVTSADPLLGGSDVISTGGGDDLMIGGALGDILLSSGGNDIVFGDFGSAAYSAGGTVINLASIDILYGGNDTLDAGAGNDILIGGQGHDLLYGTLSEDLLFGSFASMTLTNGLVSNIYGGPNDFLTTIMLNQFTATYIEVEDDDTTADELIDLYSALNEILYEMSALWNLDYLLDPDVFKRVFQLGGFRLGFGQNGSGEFDVITVSGVVSQLATANHDMYFDPRRISDSELVLEDDSHSLSGYQGDRQERQYPRAYHEAAMNELGDFADHISAPMALGLGILGLQATGRRQFRSPRSSGRF